MKRRNSLVMFFLSLAFSCFISACSNTLDSMLDGYNSNFKPVYTEKTSVVLNPGDQGFDERAMLLDKYVISNKSTINLCAPDNCTSYKWQILDPESGDLEPVQVKTMAGTSASTKRFVAYIPTSYISDPFGNYKHNGLVGGKTYRLSLSAQGKDGRIYNDYATFAIYNDYYFETGIVTIPPGAEVNQRSVLYNSSKEIISGNGRSILPNVYDIDSTGMHYYIYGLNLLTGAQVRPFEVNVVKDVSDLTNKSGDFEFDMPKGNYWLTLMALKEEPVNTSYEYLIGRCSYVGFASVDNRYNNSVTFVLKPAVNGFGRGKFKIYTMGWDISNAMFNSCEVKATVTDTLGNIVSEIGSFTNLSKANIGSLSAPEYSNYEISIRPGNYKLTVSFEYFGNTYEWSDDFTIVSGIVTEANIGIPLLIDLGRTNFKIYTDGWDLKYPEYAGYVTTLSLTKATDGSTKDYEITTYFEESNMTTAPETDNFGLLTELGVYDLNLTFSKEYKRFTASYRFIVEPGITKTEVFAVNDVIPTGLANFKIYTDGWDYSDPAYRTYSVNGVSLSVTDVITGNTVPKAVVVPFEASLTGSVPGSANYGIKAEPGSYKLNISFTNNSQTYTWSYQFTVEAGSTKTETVGISSSVIPAGS